MYNKSKKKIYIHLNYKFINMKNIMNYSFLKLIKIKNHHSLILHDKRFINLQLQIPLPLPFFKFGLFYLIVTYLFIKINLCAS